MSWNNDSYMAGVLYGMPPAAGSKRTYDDWMSIVPNGTNKEAMTAHETVKSLEERREWLKKQLKQMKSWEEELEAINRMLGAYKAQVTSG